MDTTNTIARIISGSCTPASDLLDLVNAGHVSMEQASNAMQARWGTHSSLANLAAAERAAIRARDC